MTNFRLAIETTLFAQLPLGEALQKSSECGFAMVEVGLSHFDACTARTGRRRWSRRAALAQRSRCSRALRAPGLGPAQACQVEPGDLIPGRGPAREGRGADEARARGHAKAGVQVPGLGAQRGHGRPAGVSEVLRQVDRRAPAGAARRRREDILRGPPGRFRRGLLRGCGSAPTPSSRGTSGTTTASHTPSTWGTGRGRL